MKKLKLKKPEAKIESLTREQLKFIIGGENASECMSIGDPCWAAVNCCSGFKCNQETHFCQSA
jgi:hypothetical protein